MEKYRRKPFECSGCCWVLRWCNEPIEEALVFDCQDYFTAWLKPITSKAWWFHTPDETYAQTLDSRIMGLLLMSEVVLTMDAPKPLKQPE